jgi:cytochrome c2
MLTAFGAISCIIIAAVGCNSRQVEPTESGSSADSSERKKVMGEYARGKSVFGKNCSTCHFAPERNIVDPPIFDNLFQRLPHPGEDYFVKYLKDSKALKTSGDEYALKVDEVWHQDYEHHFKDSLSTNDFEALLTYIKIAVDNKRKEEGGR